VAEEEIKPEDIDILTEVSTTLYPKPNEPQPVVLVTYAYRGLVPSVVTVPGESPSDSEIFEAIKADIIKRRTAAPRKLKLGAGE